jgi:hypothetical protein
MPINPLPRVGLNPAARPVDAFRVPNVPASAGGASLLQLAQSLASIEPKVQHVIDRQFQAHAASSQTRAKADAWKFRSMKALKAAVDRGEISEAQNPWYSVGLRQSVAEAEVSQAKQKLLMEYWAEDGPDAIRFNKDPQAFVAWADQRLSPLLEGQDAWSLEVLTPAVRDIKAALLQQHVSNSIENLELEREVFLKREIESVMSSVPANATDEQLNAARTKLAGLTTHAGKTVHPAKLESWITDAALNATVNMKRPGLGAAMLAGLPSSTGHDLAQASQGALARADEIAIDKQRQDERQQDADDERKERKLLKAASTQWLKAYDDFRKANPEATAADAYDKVAFPIDGLDPESRLALEQRRSFLLSTSETALKKKQDQEAKRLVESYYRNPLAGDLPISVVQALVKLDSLPTAEQYQQWRRLNEQKESFENDRDAHLALYEAQASGKLTPELILSYGQKINASTRNHFFELTMRGVQPGKDAERDMTIADLTLASMVSQLSIMDNGVVDEAERVQRGSIRQGQALSAKLELFEQYQEIENDKTLTPEQKAAARKDALEKATLNAFGSTPDEHRSAYKAYLDKAQQEQKPQKTAPEKKLDREVFGASGTVDPVFAEITEDDIATARWALKKPVDRPSGSQPLPGDYVLYDRESRNPNSPDPLAQFIYNSGGLFSFDMPAKSGRVLDRATGKYLDVPNQQEHLAAEEMAFRDQQVPRLKDLQARAEVAIKNWQKTVQTISATRTVTFQDKLRLLQDSNTARTYVQSRRFLGYTPEEVIQIGPGAWKHFRMFVNARDLRVNGRDTALKFGLKTKPEAEAFYNEQRKLIEQELRELQRQ